MDVKDKATSSIIDANFCLRGKGGGEGEEGREKREGRKGREKREGRRGKGEEGREKKEGRRGKGEEGRGKRGESLLVIINWSTQICRSIGFVDKLFTT